MRRRRPADADSGPLAKLIQRHDPAGEVIDRPAPARMPPDEIWPKDSDPRWFPAGAVLEVFRAWR